MSTIVIGYIKKDGTCMCYSTGKGNIPACFSNSDFHVEGTDLIDLICHGFNNGMSDKAFFDGYGLVIYDERSNTIYSAQEYTKIGQISATSVELSASSSHKYSDIPKSLEKYYFSDEVLLSSIKNKTVTCAYLVSHDNNGELETTFKFSDNVSPNDNLQNYLDHVKTRNPSLNHGFNFDIFIIDNNVSIVNFECNKEGFTEFYKTLIEINAPINKDSIEKYINDID